MYPQLPFLSKFQFAFLICICFFWQPVYAQTDTLAPLISSLPAIFVIPVDGEAGLSTTAPVARINSSDIFRYDGSSLLAGANSIPGLRFEERAPGSYRVSIRGSSLRAPFGVRNVKVYWNGLPFTEPGGDTPLNFLDPLNVAEATVFKGPAGSLYGSGVGGALLLKSSTPQYYTNYDGLNLQTGSYGSGRLSWLHRRGSSAGNLRQISVVHNRTDGYRRHSQLARTVGELSLHRNDTQGNGASFHVLATDLHYELPGGLNPEQFAENPQQARPGSEVSRAAINYQNLFVGGRLYGKLLRDIKHESGIYATANVFDHPFNFDHKREENLGIGGRSVLTYDKRLGENTRLEIIAGLEAQLAHKAARNYDDNVGEPGELNFIDDVDSRQILAFSQAELELRNGWSATAALSLQNLNYLVDRTFNAGGATGVIKGDFGWVMAPRLSIGKKWINDQTQQLAHQVFVSYGRAYSPPTLREFRTNEGGLNVDLKPEKGDSYELGFRRMNSKYLDVEFNVYYQKLSETITTFQGADDVQLFRNAGSSRQFGLELALEKELLGQGSRAAGPLNSLNARVAYTYQSGQYATYTPNGNDFSGQELPGLTPHVFDWQLTLRSKPGYYAGLGLYTASRTPLNDANDVFAEAFAILRARIGYNFEISNTFLNLYCGGANLLDQQYSLGYDLNPQFGRRYFQPAAGRTFFVGLRLNI